MRERISIDNAAKLVELTQVKCGGVAEVAWSPDGKVLAVAGETVVQLYAGTFGGQPTHTLKAHTGPVTGMAFSPHNSLLVSASADKTIKVWDLSYIQIKVSEVATLTGHRDSINTVAFSPNGQLFATGSADGLVCLWDAQTHRQTAQLKGHQKAVSAVAFAIRGNLVVSGGQDNTVRLWDTHAETEGTIIGAHDGAVNAVCCNPPGTMIASGCQDGTVRLWDAFSGNQYAVIDAHNGAVNCIAFSPYGELMATGGADQVVRIWDVQRVLADRKAGSSNALAVLESHQNPVVSVAFNPPGTLLASGRGDGIVHLWSIPED